LKCLCRVLEESSRLELAAERVVTPFRESPLGLLDLLYFSYVGAPAPSGHCRSEQATTRGRGAPWFAKSRSRTCGACQAGYITLLKNQLCCLVLLFTVFLSRQGRFDGQFQSSITSMCPFSLPCCICAEDNVDLIVAEGGIDAVVPLLTLFPPGNNSDLEAQAGTR
jgi:hypothetical protein